MKAKFLLSIGLFLCLIGNAFAVVDGWKYRHYPIDQIKEYKQELQQVEREAVKDMKWIPTFFVQNVYGLPWFGIKPGQPWDVKADGKAISTTEMKDIYIHQTFNNDDGVVTMFERPEVFFRTQFGQDLITALDGFQRKNALYVGDRLIFKPIAEFMENYLRDKYQLNVSMGNFYGPMPFLSYLKGLTDLMVEGQRFERTVFGQKKVPVGQIVLYESPQVVFNYLDKYGKQQMVSGRLVGAPQYRYRNGYKMDGVKVPSDMSSSITIDQNRTVNGKKLLLQTGMRPFNNEQVMADYGYFEISYSSAWPEDDFQHGTHNAELGTGIPAIVVDNRYAPVVPDPKNPRDYMRDPNGKPLTSRVELQDGTIEAYEVPIAHPYFQRLWDRMNHEYREVSWSFENGKINILGEQYKRWKNKYNLKEDFETKGWNYFLLAPKDEVMRTKENKKLGIPAGIPYKIRGFMYKHNSPSAVPEPLPYRGEIEKKTNMGQNPMLEYGAIDTVLLETGRGAARDLLMMVRQQVMKTDPKEDFVWINNQIKTHPDCENEVQARKDISEIIDILTNNQLKAGKK